MVGGEGDESDGGVTAAAQMPEPFMCEWFVADDSTGLHRLFVVEGSDSVDSWKSNLTFEPAQFEDLPGVTSRHTASRTRSASRGPASSPRPARTAASRPTGTTAAGARAPRSARSGPPS